MQTVLEYDLDFVEAELEVPKHAKFLKVAIEDDVDYGYVIKAYYFGDNEEDTLTRKEVFRVIGAGWDLEDDFSYKFEYVDSITSGSITWHVFRKILNSGF